MSAEQHHSTQSRLSRYDEYKANSLSLAGSVAMGTGVMIGAGIFALTGQVTDALQFGVENWHCCVRLLRVALRPIDGLAVILAIDALRILE